MRRCTRLGRFAALRCHRRSLVAGVLPELQPRTPLPGALQSQRVRCKSSSAMSDTVGVDKQWDWKEVLHEVWGAESPRARGRRMKDQERARLALLRGHRVGQHGHAPGETGAHDWDRPEPTLPVFSNFGDLEADVAKWETTRPGLTEMPPPPKMVEPDVPLPKQRPDGSATGHGGRKRASAWVHIKEGPGRILINRKPLEDYFQHFMWRERVLRPLVITETLDRFEITVRVRGGGVSCQARAIRHALARALLAWNPMYRLSLKRVGLLTRDPRKVERKKTGKPKARKSEQWSKR